MTLHQCSEHGYTLQAACPKCGKATSQPGPAKYSPEDRYGKYRRQLKLMERSKQRGASASRASGPMGA